MSAGAALPGAAAAAAAPPGALRRTLRRPGGALGAGIVAALALAALFAPWIAPFDPQASDWMAVREGPSWKHPLGTDELGRDTLSRLIHGARASLLAGGVSVLIAIGLGVPLGVAAGYLRGWADAAISRLTEAMLACPFLILAIALAAFLGPSLTNAMVAIGVSAAPAFVRLTRTQVLAVMAEDHIEGARAVGAGHLRIVRRYVLRNALPPLVVQACLAGAAAIIAEASLSFLGLGQQPPAPSWGSMLNTAKNFLELAPWMSVWPGLAIFLAVLGFNLLGDALNAALDPRAAPRGGGG